MFHIRRGLRQKIKGGNDMQMKLIEVRKKNKLTQKDMAALLGINVAAYRDREQGRTDFKLYEVFLISHYFHRCVGDLFNNSGMRKADKIRRLR